MYHRRCCHRPQTLTEDAKNHGNNNALLPDTEPHHVLLRCLCRNMIAILISLELMLNSVDINFAVFNRFLFPGELEGMFFTLFAIGIAAAETALAIAIIINVFRVSEKIDVRDVNKMKF